ncbi:MAG TPA: hypothetical protein VFQ23_18865 [Anaerolineales bacterium]|nr:hypothetical protein [Anaerolineales bacterium]
MPADKIVRIGAFASILSGVTWLLLTPFMATIGICQGACLYWQSQPLIVRTLGRAVANQGWLSFAEPETLYFSYGRYFFLVYVFMMLGLFALHRAHSQRVIQPHQLDRRAYIVLLSSLIIAAVGDFISYGIGVVSQAAWRGGFGLEAIAWLGIMLGAFLYGLVILRHQVFHPVIGLLLILVTVLLPVTFFDRSLIQYAPNAQLLPFAVVWPILGMYLLFGKSRKSV